MLAKRLATLAPSATLAVQAKAKELPRSSKAAAST